MDNEQTLADILNEIQRNISNQPESIDADTKDELTFRQVLNYCKNNTLKLQMCFISAYAIKKEESSNSRGIRCGIGIDTSECQVNMDVEIKQLYKDFMHIELKYDWWYNTTPFGEFIQSYNSGILYRIEKIIERIENSG